MRGTSGLEREVLSRVPGMTQNAAITGLNLVAPWLGTTTAVLADAGAAETRYRHDSGADYDAKAAAALGARVIGGDTAGILAGELVRDYAETLRELYAERRRQAAPPQLAEPDRPRLPQSAYADALSRLEDSNGTDLTKPVSAYSAPPSVIELPETVGASATQTAYDAMQPNSVLEAFLPTKNYISKDGAFQLEAANADYGKLFLPTVPEKNRMYLQQAADAVDFLMTDDPRITLGYDVKTDAIIYNPSGPTFSSYDWDNVLTHELAHRIDWWFADSIGNENFIREIAAAKFTPAKTWENLVGYCWRNDKEGYLSDIIGALSESEYDLPFYHERSYWNEKKKAAETFANLFSLESLGDMEKLSTLKNAFPRLLQAYESLDFSLQTR